MNQEAGPPQAADFPGDWFPPGTLKPLTEEIIDPSTNGARTAAYPDVKE